MRFQRALTPAGRRLWYLGDYLVVVIFHSSVRRAVMSFSAKSDNVVFTASSLAVRVRFSAFCPCGVVRGTRIRRLFGSASRTMCPSVSRRSMIDINVDLSSPSEFAISICVRGVPSAAVASTSVSRMSRRPLLRHAASKSSDSTLKARYMSQVKSLESGSSAAVHGLSDCASRSASVSMSSLYSLCSECLSLDSLESDDLQ